MIIAIAGGTGSGKTTTAQKMAEYNKDHFGLNTIVISMDNYYKNSHHEQFENYDHPDAFDIDLLYNDLASFLSTRKIAKRHYCYVSKERSLIETYVNVDMVILEGLYAFYDPKLREISHKKIYLDIDEKTRIKRRMERDLEERGISLEENWQMINGFVRKMHDHYISKQQEFADMLYLRNEDVDMVSESV